MSSASKLSNGRRKADALVMSCGGLRTLDVIVPLEKAIGVPVVSSTPHGLWHCARMLGVKNPSRASAW